MNLVYNIIILGGAALGYYHIGLAKALWNEGLLPRVISGASAGSMIAATLGTRTDDELIDILEKCSIRTDFFKFNDKEVEVKAASKNNFAINFQFYLPQSIRWFGDILIRSMYDRKSVLKNATDHLKEVLKFLVTFIFIIIRWLYR